MGGPLVMRTEDLKECLREAKREKDPERRKSELVVRLVQVMSGMGPYWRQ